MRTSWAPALLLAHLAVLGLAAVVVIALWQAGIGSGSELLRAPVPVQLVGWVLAGVTFHRVRRAVGPRQLSRLPRWAIATVTWPVVVCTWVAVPLVAAFPANPGPVLGTVALVAAIPAALALLVGAFVVLVLVQPSD